MKVDCVNCDKELDVDTDDYVTGESLGEIWCRECAEVETREAKKEDVRRINHNENERYLFALREIDVHIRSTDNPVPYIVKTLKRVLPEYD